MDENSSCCECLSPLACMCRYNTVETGGWFYIYVVQCLLISPWAICLIFSSSLFTQRDSHFMAFSLPLATLCVLACMFVHLCVWLSQAVLLKMCFTDVWRYYLTWFELSRKTACWGKSCSVLLSSGENLRHQLTNKKKKTQNWCLRHNLSSVCHFSA